MRSSDIAADSRQHDTQQKTAPHSIAEMVFPKLLDNADLMLDQIRAFKLYSYHGARNVVLLFDIWGTFHGGWHMARVFQDLQMETNHAVSVARLDCWRLCACNSAWMELGCDHGWWWSISTCFNTSWGRHVSDNTNDLWVICRFCHLWNFLRQQSNTKCVYFEISYMKPYIRRKFRSQTSDNMDRWKSRGGKRQGGEEQKREDKRRERLRRKKMYVPEKVGKSRNTVFFPESACEGFFVKKQPLY